MKLFKEFIRSRASGILLFFLCFCCVFLLFFLYGVETEAAIYALLLCLPAAAGMQIRAYFRFAAKRRHLMRLEESAYLETELLPETDDPAELGYQRLVERLQRENVGTATAYEQRRAELEDTCALWMHQIKTPIAAMQLLLRDGSEQSVREAQAELFKIEQYADMALGFLRLEGETDDFVFRTVSLDDLLRRTVKKFSKQFILQKLTLCYTETGLSVLTDEKWCCFVLEQLLSNALKYTKKGKISIYAEGTTLCIRDTGIGIMPEDLPRVFEKGYTGGNGRIEQKSTGLGLYLCRKTVDRLNHGLSLVSQPGQGTEARIDFNREALSVE